MVVKQTRLGAVQGTERESVERFLGLPYAAPPVGEWRWREPQPAAPWQGIHDATQFPDRCWQAPPPDVLSGRPTPGELSEDCLYLNIYTPAGGGSGRPVLFWIHGGAYVIGTANTYDGTALARDHDVVVVAVNYRLGIFGFQNIAGLGDAYRGSGNRGLQDQVAALSWVRDNIADYGGDPDNVTIFGQSAGGTSVLSLYAIPSAKGLFHRAIAFSGTNVSAAPIDGVTPLAEHFGCDGDDLLKLALSASASDLFALQQKIGGAFSTHVDGEVITQMPAAALLAGGDNNPPLIAGCNIDEGTIFTDYSKEMGDDDAMIAGLLPMFALRVNPDDPAGYERWVKSAQGDKPLVEQMERWWYDAFRSASVRHAAAASRAGSASWVFNFNVPGMPPLGATHGSEIPFTFNSFADDEASMLFFHDKNRANRQLAQLWSSMVVQFARTGDPNDSDNPVNSEKAGLPEWPQYDDRAACLVFDTNPHVEFDPDGADLRAVYGTAD